VSNNRFNPQHLDFSFSFFNIIIHVIKRALYIPMEGVFWNQVITCNGRPFCFNQMDNFDGSFPIGLTIYFFHVNTRKIVSL
jgi:hypothetical protein